METPGGNRRWRVLGALVLMTCIGCSIGPDEEPPLIYAASVGDDLEVRQLVESGVDVDSPDDLGYTALIAAAGIHDSTVTLLLELGADVNAVNDDGDSALFLATYRGSAYAMQILLDAGADRDVVPNGGSLAGLSLCEAGKKSDDEAAASLAC